ncbi:DUF554 domain-containing protein [Bacillus coahuilensis]|uniref:DUF554 domain-containing protein n=1 Tax=Bacillus coahuilensis TaxID=408580 RepID=UPI00018507B4|nr:DUF554 domain-containing protein [Bacillus coahuilensis]
MVLLGSLVNAGVIVVCTLFGLLLHRIPDRIKGTVMNAISLAVIVLGLQMSLKTENFIFVIVSLVLGAIIGESIQLEDRLNSIGEWIERRFGNGSDSSIAQGFVTATLIFVIGAMSVLGALDSGLRNDHDVLFTKSIIDGFTAMILTSTLGIGVLFSAIPVFLYEGGIALFATVINKIVPEVVMETFLIEMTATGGVMIFAIGLNLLGLTKIRAANLLPSLFVVAILVVAEYFFM